MESVLPSIRVDEPFAHAALEIEPAEQAYLRVLKEVGATLPKRDAVDARVLEMVRTGRVNCDQIAETSQAKAAAVGYAPHFVEELAESVQRGYITEPSEVGGYPTYEGTPYVDTDNDGLPDAWEMSHGLKPEDASDSAIDSDGDGYVNIEEFINGQ